MENKKRVKKVNPKIKKRKKKNSPLMPILFVIIFLLSALVLLLAFVDKDKITEVFNSVTNQQQITKETEQVEKQQEEQPIVEEQKPPEKPPVNFSEFNHYSFTHSFDVNTKGNLLSVDYKIYLPREDYAKQYIKINSISLQPDSFNDEDGNTVAKYKWKNISNQNFHIEVNGEAKVRTYDLKTAKRFNYNISPETDLSRYLQSEELIESDDPFVIDIANSIGGNSREEILQNIYVYLQKNIKYTIVPNLGAKRTLTEKIGKCADYTAAMVALCRAKGIPARVVAGEMFDEQGTAHAWAEVYYDEYGWVTYDPTFEGTYIQHPNGKVERKLDSTEVPIDYLQTVRNLLSKRPIMMYYRPNQQGNAQISDKLEFQKL